MASVGHVAVGLAAARRWGGDRRRVLATLALPALSLLPDVDVLGFARGVPYGSPFGHRGATHSLAAALLVGLAAAALARPLRLNPLTTFALVTGVVASHGLLDTMTDGGLGVALLWPFSLRRFFFVWRPIPVAPIGLGLLSRRGAAVLALESVQFSPFWLYALWPRRRPGAERARDLS
ncbi:MAG TPA: metal-dependent hydrolase [Myxococcales bacterium]|nr:metal-dependent hydrolase [Myxococcales bacterium]